MIYITLSANYSSRQWRLLLLITWMISGTYVWSQQSSTIDPITDLLSRLSLNIDDITITDQYISGGIQHTYLKRQINGLRLYNSQASIHQKLGRSPISQAMLYPGLDASHISNKVTLPIEEAIKIIGSRSGYITFQSIVTIRKEVGRDRRMALSIPEISYEPIQVSLLLYVVDKQDLRYVWQIAIDEVSSGHWINYFIDAESGEILHQDDWTVECKLSATDHEHCDHEHRRVTSYSSSSDMMTDSTYHVFPYPVESPNYGVRSMETTPWHANNIASPNGWHHIDGTDYTTSRGNNVDAYLDDDHTNNPTGGDAARVDGGSQLIFDFPWSASDPLTSVSDAALTNLFYWNNIVHDVWYNYGFDEPSGNFQSENLQGQGGTAQDYVRAEAQETTINCNANFSTPPDGTRPRMQMFLCNNVRDASLDNGVIVHEYGHGISNRLTGGPSASGCLGNAEQMGEGWSDWFALMMTIEDGDQATDSRPIGTWLFNQGPNGAGIRPYPYTTDMTVNPMTYASISGVSVPHGVGSVWCTMLWDLSWALMDEYGSSSDIYNGTAGNNMAMSLIIEALKIQPCNPGFVDGRDAILAADELLYNGDNQCLIWQVFANRGLGYSAVQGSSNSVTDGAEAFDMPPSCTLEILKVADATDVDPGDQISYTMTVTNHDEIDQHNLVVKDILPDSTSWISSPGGTVTDDSITWSQTMLTIDESVDYTLTVQVSGSLDPIVDEIYDDMESGDMLWTVTQSGSTSWQLQSTTYHSATTAWYAADASSTGSAELRLASSIGVSTGTKVTFVHYYDTEATWDGGTIEISSDGGKTWQDAGTYITVNGYNSTVFNSRPGYSGDSGGFITSVIDLSTLDGMVIDLKWTMNCDAYVGGNGWYIDDVLVEGQSRYIPNIATATTDEYSATGVLLAPTKVNSGPIDFVVSGMSQDLSCHQSNDGMASVSATGGSGSYTYLWSTGATIPAIDGLSVGIYYVDVSDGNLTRRKHFYIQAPDEINAQLVVTDAIGAPNGSITSDVIGGNPPYTYLWSTGATTDYIEDLGPDTYMVTITDSHLCTLIAEAVIVDKIETCSDEAYVLSIQADQYPDEISYHLKDGNFNTLYSFTMDNEAQGALHQEVLCLPEGCYTLTVADSFGDGVCAGYSNPQGYVKVEHYDSGVVLLDSCDFELIQFEICEEPTEVTLETIAPTCPGDADGSVTAIPTGGEYSYTYVWNTGATTATISGVGAGYYSVTVDDGETSTSQSAQLGYDNSKVKNNLDTGPGSLRAVLDNGCPVDSITFDSSLIGDTIYLESELIVDKSVHIYGLGMFGLTISGQSMHRIFQVTPTGILTLRTISLLDGFNSITGGAIYNQGQLIIDNVMLKDHFHDTAPEAITNQGIMSLRGIVDIR